MSTSEEHKLDHLLQQARNTVPAHSREGVFLQILETLDKEAQPRLSYRGLRNTGLGLLLLAAVNLGTWALAGSSRHDEAPPAQETYLQSYNLNLY